MKKPTLSLADRLKSAGLRCTPQRLQLLQVLERQKRYVSADEIHRDLREACDLVTVYRNLQQLESSGLLERTQLSDQVARYRLVESENRAHGHHIECRRCRRLTVIDDCLVSEQVRVLERLGFRQVTHRLEFEALCPSCA